MYDFTNADRYCDLVMKGGITSGILYPPAVCRIAEQFHFVGLGGTSAGAIAACTAAAAEYRRRHTGTGKGFERLAQLPHDLANEGCLAGLFRPDRATREIFDLLMGAMSLKTRSQVARTKWGMRALKDILQYKRLLSGAVDNGFGLCSGMSLDNPPPTGSIAPLTIWLSQTIDEIAGKDDGDPLTFGDLRHSPRPPSLAELMGEDSQHSIDLRTVTTCVSFGRPMELPLDGKHIFAFDEQEWRLLFPGYIVDYLIRVAEKIDAPTFKHTGKLPLPVGDAMPVVVASRMSLSFPGLFTMVPLYAFDYEGGGKLKKVWLSDGGITSNFPMHSFDALFPRWPTLAINLQYTDKEGHPARSVVDTKRMIYMISRRQDGTRDLWNSFDVENSPAKAFIGFASAIFRSAQVWHDNSYLTLPGYRDRVIEIWLTNDEGGMNLDMPGHVIERLITRGDAAGVMLRKRFAETSPDDQLSWDGHRWVRLRSALTGLMEYLLEFKCSADQTSRHERSLAELLSKRNEPPTHPFKSRQYQHAKKAIEDILEYIGSVESLTDVCNDKDHATQTCHSPFCGGPRPAVVIGSKARM